MIHAEPVIGAAGWRLAEQNGYLVAIAGADEVWVVDDVPGEIATELAACWSDRPPTADRLSAPARLAVEQLRAVGVFGSASRIGTRPRLAVLWAGAEAPELFDRLRALCHSLDWPEPSTDPDQAEVQLIVRTSATLEQTAALAATSMRGATPQFLCDLGSARTVALGPFVVPGHTACIGCLSARIAQRWGDPAPPTRPGAAGPGGSGVAAALLCHQIELAISGRFTLVDRTISIDLDSLESQSSPCLRSAYCQVCADLVSDGRVALPWT